MSESLTITLAKGADGLYSHSSIPFDPDLPGDMLAYPSISRELLLLLQQGTPQEVQKILATLVNF